MIFYRVHYSTNGGNSAGFSWHTSKADARAAAKKDYDQDPSEYENDPASIAERIIIFEIPITRAGVIHALKHFASHADNG
jgi:hypothetical protein